MKIPTKVLLALAGFAMPLAVFAQSSALDAATEAYNRRAYESMKPDIERSRGTFDGIGRFQTFMSPELEVFNAFLDTAEPKRVLGESAIAFLYDAPHPRGGLRTERRVALVTCGNGRYVTYRADQPEPPTQMLRAAPGGPGMGEMLRAVCAEAGLPFGRS